MSPKDTATSPAEANRPAPDTAPAATPDFERTLADLETLVTELEGGELPLDEAVQAFERGMQLSRSCQAALAQAEQKVRILLDAERTDDGGLDDFAASE